MLFSVRSPNKIIRFSDVVQKQNHLGMEHFLECPKSKRSDFIALMYIVEYLNYVFICSYDEVKKDTTTIHFNYNLEANAFFFVNAILYFLL